MNHIVWLCVKHYFLIEKGHKIRESYIKLEVENSQSRPLINKPWASFAVRDLWGPSIPARNHN